MSLMISLVDGSSCSCFCTFCYAMLMYLFVKNLANAKDQILLFLGSSLLSLILSNTRAMVRRE